MAAEEITHVIVQSLISLVFLSLVPRVNEIAKLDITAVGADAVRTSLGEVPTQLIFPPIVSFLMLGAATMLSIYKPWRHTPWSQTDGERKVGHG